MFRAERQGRVLSVTAEPRHDVHMPRRPEPTVLALLPDAGQRLLRTVDALPEGAWSEPSLLPHWTRAHVVAHLVLNAEGLTGVLRGLVRDEPTPMYPSQERRDADIAEVAGRSPSELRTRLLATTTHFADAVAALPEERWGDAFERTPGGPRFHAGSVPGMRLREVEIHHADLGVDYSREDWPSEFTTLLVEVLSRRLEVPVLLRADDTGETWRSAADAPDDARVVVSGRARDLAWWLTGRGDGSELSSQSGDLPRIGAL